jgi:hypothetical protein
LEAAPATGRAREQRVPFSSAIAPAVANIQPNVIAGLLD